eukprot:TRINITY_DN26988_c1_g3_i1.p1 TRINITY_DN26988_c1_g3~~TRINITY_DN26988_c1_g3_i1.p1  ORF type:complete len:304 (-),score=41.97 TRINITY_DN26988_c1_g3_i1:212-1123(-)
MAMVSNDEMIAQAMARRQQEQADEELAKMLFETDRIDHDAAVAREIAASAGGIDPGLRNNSHNMLNASAMKALYVSCIIGQHEVEMLVDTGAEMSVISESLARQLNLSDRVDRRYRGTAKGVGSAQIIGKVFDVPVQLGHVEFELNFSVLQLERCELILGLDLMRHFKCLVDLEKNSLVFGGAGGVAVPFLASARARAPPVSAALLQGHRAAELLMARDPGAARVALQTVGRILQNIALQPTEPKYRRLRGSNQRLQREVLAHPEAVEILRLAGFVAEEGDMLLPPLVSLGPLRQLSDASFLH